MIRPLRSPMKTQQDDNHDQHGLDQVHQKSIDRLGDGVGLHGDDPQLHAHRDAGHQFADALFDGIAHGHGVAALNRGDGDADGGRAVIPQKGSRWIHVVAPDLGHILEVDQFAPWLAMNSSPKSFSEVKVPVGKMGTYSLPILILPASAGRFLASGRRRSPCG